jgi:hypothetical protein
MPTKPIVIWEAPRCRGTSVSFAIYNGIRTMGLPAVLLDEPLHWRRVGDLSKRSVEDRIEFLDKQINTEAAKNSNAILIIKNQAKQLFTTEDLGDEIQLLDRYHNMITIRHSNEMLQSHQKALDLMTDIPQEITYQGSGIPALHALLIAFECFSVRHCVIDTDKLLINPASSMKKITSFLNIPYSKHFIFWQKVNLDIPPWGEHWYTHLLGSTGFSRTNRQSLATEEHALNPEIQTLVHEIQKRSI